MLTEFVRDQTFTVAWFGLMAFVWLGWSQEDPPPSWRKWLGLGSALGVALALGFGFLTARHWSDGTALDGRYHWFGVLVAVEVAAAGAGSAVLARRNAGRWTAWWVALVVALHFLPLAALLDDASIAVFGVLQCAGLLLLVGSLRRGDVTTSRHAGPLMGTSLLAYAAVSAALVALDGTAF
ncbi:hypothetical protein [Actinocorallia populi]|uniref:hypothetical protein n=1 Tax=Actinocorallia populi TaxID=2079200 RepID=UPI000D08B4E7|nr:hypothetical protein [Actinocorallia populi]